MIKYRKGKKVRKKKDTKPVYVNFENRNYQVLSASPTCGLEGYELDMIEVERVKGGKFRQKQGATVANLTVAAENPSKRPLGLTDMLRLVDE